ncbi:MAG: tRNA 4-thiouridine(8) synthase ThiI, partial [Gemmatimonadota bacterium]
RPLVGFDKREIIDRSREIGTYALSEKVREHCALTEERPVTDATPAEASAAEAGLDGGVLEMAVAGRRTLDLRALDVSDLVLPYLYTTEIPTDAVLIDTRPPSQYEPWHYPGAVQRDYWELLQDHESLDRDRTYVLYCEIGLRSAQLAEKLQQAGFEAYSFKGGARALREYAAAQGVSSA